MDGFDPNSGVILIDIKNVNSDKLKLVEDMKAFLDKIVEELKLNVVIYYLPREDY